MHDLACHRSTGITELIDPAHVHNETQRIAASLGIDIAFHAEHLSTGQSVGWQDDEYRTMASTMKLPTAIALLNRVDKGELSLDAMHTFTQKDMRMGGWLTEPLVKRQGTIALSTFSVIDAAMRVSDNAAWLKMVELCGGIEYVQAFLAEKGIEGVRSTDDLFAGYPELLQSLGYDRVMAPSLLKAEHRPVVFEKQLTPERDACTPRGMVGLLKGLFRGELVSAANTRLLLDIMESCETSERKLRALLPPHTRVADKTGSIAGLVAADAGLVTMPGDQDTFAIAIFSRAPDRSQDVLDSAVAHVGRLAYDYFLLSPK